MNEFLLTGMGSWPVTFLASFLFWIMVGAVLMLWLIDGKVKKEAAVRALIAIFFSLAIVEIIKAFFPAIRPFKLNGFPPLTLTVPSDHSFPSQHSAAAFALALAIWLRNKKLGAPFFLAASGVAIGRFLANVHYPQDILVGAFIGLVVAIIVNKLKIY